MPQTNVIKVKRTTVPSKVPTTSDIVAGELAANLIDKILYTRDTSNNIISLTGVVSNIAGTGISLSGTNNVTISIDSTVATLTGSQTLTNKTISGSNNTISNIGNSSLTNSSITINGTTVSLGGTATITVAAAGSDTQVQYNSSNVLTGSANLTFDGTRLTAAALTVDTNTLYVDATNDRVGIGTSSPARTLHVHNAVADNHLYLSSVGPSIIMGNNVTFASSTMYYLMAMATANGQYGLNAGDTILGNYGNSRGNLHINSNYSGTGTTNVIMQPSSGSVGIGIAPTTKLHVAAATNNGLSITSTDGTTFRGILFNTNDSALSMGTTTAHGIAFYTSNAERASISSAGDVIIGNASNPGNTLRYLDLYNTNTGASAGVILRLITSNSAGTSTNSVDIVRYKIGLFVINNNDSNGIITINNAGSERMRIDSSGNVGIGTTDPKTRLHIGAKVADDNGYSHDTNALYAVHQTATATATLNDPKEILLLARQGTSGQAFGAAASFRLSRYENVSVNSRTRLDLVLAHDGFLTSPTTVMTLLSSGNVGIGTSSPAAKLDIRGAGAGIIVAPDNNSAGGISLFGTNAQTYGSPPIYFLSAANNGGYPTAGVGLGSLDFRNSAYGQGAYIYAYATQNHSSTASGGELRFGTTLNGSTSASERMRIDSSGNVGIGVTPSNRLHVGGIVQIDQVAGLADLYMGAGTTGNSGKITYDNNNVRFIFSLGASEKMRIDSSGNVGIGTTNPLTKLQVGTAAGGGGADGNTTLSAGTLMVYGVATSGAALTWNAYTNGGNTNTVMAQLRPRQDTSANYNLDVFCGTWNNNNNPGTAVATFQSTGNVGIGTSTIGGKLTIVSGDSATASNQVIISGGRSVSNGAGAILFTNSFWNSGFGAANIVGLDSGGSGGHLSFGTLVDGGGASGTPTEKMRILQNGNVGIGTASPDALLTVNTIASFGDGAQTTPSIAHKGDLNTGFWFPAADNIAVSVGGVEGFRFDSAGRFQAGGTTGLERINVIGSYQGYGWYNTGAAANEKYWRHQVHDANRSLMIQAVNDAYNAAATPFEIVRNSGTYTTQYVRIAQDGGNVGIGTASPDALLHVASGTTTSLNLARIYAGSLASGSAVDMYIGKAASSNQSGTFGFHYNSTSTSSYAYMGIYGDSATTGITLTSGGKVGIGKQQSTYSLEISADSAAKPGAGGLWTVVSDERIKTNIIPADLDRCYEIVRSVPLKHYGFAPGVYGDNQIQDKHNLGWIAQDVQKVFKNAVSTKPFTLHNNEVIQDCLDLNSGQLIAALYGAVQSLMQKVEELQRKI